MILEDLAEHDPTESYEISPIVFTGSNKILNLFQARNYQIFWRFMEKKTSRTRPYKMIL